MSAGWKSYTLSLLSLRDWEAEALSFRQPHFQGMASTSWRKTLLSCRRYRKISKGQAEESRCKNPPLFLVNALRKGGQGPLSRVRRKDSKFFEHPRAFPDRSSKGRLGAELGFVKALQCRGLKGGLQKELFAVLRTLSPRGEQLVAQARMVVQRCCKVPRI